MSRDEIIEPATKVMHAEVCCPCDPQGCDWTTTPEARYARALADAGLLARPLPDREETAGTIAGWMYTTDEPRDFASLSYKVTDAVLDLLKGQDT